MKRFKDLNIGKKFTLLLMATSLGSFVTALILFTGLAIYKTKSSYTRDLKSTVEILAQNCQAAMLFNIPEDAQKLLEAMAKRPSVISAVIIDQSGEKFAEFHVKDPKQHISSPLLADYLLSTTPIKVCSEITVDEKRLGTLCLVDNMQEIKSVFVYYLYGILILTILSLFGLYAISKRVQHLITTPIIQLTAAVKQVSEQKDYSIRMHTRRQDEIGVLVQAFNYMLEQIQARDTQIKMSEMRYKALFESANDAILILHDNSIIHCNRKAEEMFGYNRNELIGKTLERIYSPTSAIIASDSPIVTPMSFEIECVRKDGTTFHAEISITSVMVEDGESLFQVIVRDISERKAYEEELMRLALAIEHAAEDIMITDENGVIQYVNPAFEKITGYSRVEAIGQNPRILKSGKHDQKFYQNFWTTIKSGRIWQGKFINKRKDGTLIEEEATVSPIVTSKGEIRGFVAIKRDVTEQVKIERHLRQAQKLEAIGTLAGGIAHDFNNILAGIFGYTEIALHNLQDPYKARQNLEQLLKAAIRAKELVSQILTFSRSKETEPQPLRIQPIIKECLKLLRASLPKNINLKAELQSDGVVFADPIHIHQMVMNLCTNATHALGERGGDISIKLEDVSLDRKFKSIHPEAQTGDYIKLTIADTGSGMPPEVLEHIFEPFFTTKEEGKGTGLGLSIVHGIVKQAGGFIIVHSEVGEGSTFEIYLPRLTHIQKKQKIHAKGPPKGRGERILVVDDEQSITHLADEMLTMLGYEVVTANDGINALEIIRKSEKKFDLVITDLSMPNITGIQVAQEIRSAGFDIPVVLCSGFPEDLTDDVLEEFGISALIRKPVTFERLAKIIREILDSRLP